jgi:ankyrin repeat protein
VEAIETLVAAGAEVNHGLAGRCATAAENVGFTALYAAALNGHVAAIRALLAAGADPNRADNGCTPLAAARRNRHEAAALALVQAGAAE